MNLIFVVSVEFTLNKNFSFTQIKFTPNLLRIYIPRCTQFSPLNRGVGGVFSRRGLHLFYPH